ncbi:MAG: hypothetical protein K8R90_07520 [Candidatus Cloacimonetes bacterium]|nr:hypothetical protein [Candidatus Cloacimonadota bacterium]
MKLTILCTLMLLLALTPLTATKYAGEIFRMGAGVRNYALGGCGVADAQTVAPAYWNPALLLHNPTMRFELMHAEEYAGELAYDVAAATFGEAYPMSVALARIGMEDNPLTQVADPSLPSSNENRPYAYKWVTNADYVLWLGFARQLGGWTLGVSPKLAWRKLAEETAFGFGADIGALFEPKPDWLVGLRVRDVFTTQIFWSGDGSRESVNPGLDIESNLPFTVPLLKRPARLFTAIETYSEGREEAATNHLGPISFDYHVGLAVEAHRNVDVLAGWDVNHPTAGLSLKIDGWRLHYAFEHHAALDNSHRIAAGYTF